jgi:septal ring factor EnvC (AmiA/AmiB activator)
MTRDEIWDRYTEAMALLAKAEKHTAALREALAQAEADEAALRAMIEAARDDLDALARREAGGMWISYRDWIARRDSGSPAEVLRAISAVRENGRLEIQS